MYSNSVSTAVAISKNLSTMGNFYNPYSSKWKSGTKEGNKWKADNAPSLHNENEKVEQVQNSDDKNSFTPRKVGIFTIYENKTEPVIITKYNQKFNVIQGSLVVGCDKDFSMYQAVKWFQTINTDDPKAGKDNHDIDVREGSSSIFYSDDELVRVQIEQTFEDRGITGKYKFADFPDRGINRAFYWVAELSLVGIDSEGKNHILGSLSWGILYNPEFYHLPRNIDAFIPEKLSEFHTSKLNV